MVTTDPGAGAAPEGDAPLEKDAGGSLLLRAFFDLVPVLSILGMAALAFFVGTLVVTLRVFPFQHLEEPLIAARALHEKHWKTTRTHGGGWEMGPSRWPRVGVTRLDPARAFEGGTLVCSATRPDVELIDLSGQVLHRWSVTFRAVWPAAPHVASPVPESRIFVRRARAFSDGRLLVALSGYGDTPYGYGLVMLDAESQVLWSVAENVHHDLDVGPDGRIYTLSHGFASYGDEAPRASRMYLEDYLLVVSPAGEVTDRIPLYPAMAASRYGDSLRPWGRDRFEFDPIHANTVLLVTPEHARAHPYAQPGQVLICMRTVNVLVLLDLEERQIVWAGSGPWLRPHHPRLLEDGTILLFDNQGHVGPEGISRVIEYDATRQQVTWEYTGSETDPLYSSQRGTVQRLPNGNTLITESEAGRLLEVTRDGDVVWQFVAHSGFDAVPTTGARGPAVAVEEARPQAGLLLSGVRYPWDQLSFLDRRPAAGLGAAPDASP